MFVGRAEDKRQQQGGNAKGHADRECGFVAVVAGEGGTHDRRADVACDGETAKHNPEIDAVEARAELVGGEARKDAHKCAEAQADYRDADVKQFAIARTGKIQRVETCQGEYAGQH